MKGLGKPPKILKLFRSEQAKWRYDRELNETAINLLLTISSNFLSGQINFNARKVLFNVMKRSYQKFKNSNKGETWWTKSQNGLP